MSNAAGAALSKGLTEQLPKTSFGFAVQAVDGGKHNACATPLLQLRPPPDGILRSPHSRFGVRFGLAANDIVHPRIPRQQGRPAQQALRGLRPADELAPSLGAHLG
ncbi:hypothetical protein [Methylibium sp. T29-B]|uniref:hypothetical protein n=1 Tax=Methylibium sp. T29-B TaxID=1437443 RepID=UPI0038F72F90